MIRHMNMTLYNGVKEKYKLPIVCLFTCRCDNCKKKKRNPNPTDTSFFFCKFFFEMAAEKRKTPLVKGEERKVSKEEEKVVLLADESSKKKWQNWWVRTVTTLMMIGTFFLILASGHIWVILMVIAISTVVYNEVLQIAQGPAKDSSFKWFKTMSWYISLYEI